MKEFAGRVLMLVENAFPQDTRVRNEAEALTGAGYKVIVVALRRPNQKRAEVVNGVQVYRIPRLELFRKTIPPNPSWLRRVQVKVESVIGYVCEYFYFTTACLFATGYVSIRHGLDVLHVHNPPDTLVFVGLPFKLLGKRYVFDHHDLCPELYQSRYGASTGFLVRTLRWLEWLNLRLADVTIATNESYKRVQIERGGRRPESIFVVRNGPSRDLMQGQVAPSLRLRQLNRKILCYIGSLNPQDGVDYLLRSLHILRYRLNRDDFHCIVIGSGDSLVDLRRLAAALELDDHVEFAGFVPDEELRACLAAADICVDPDPSSPLNNVSTWIKVMEYMAYAKPIVSFDLKETRVSAGEAALFVPCNDELAFAKATARLMDDEQARTRMGQFGRMRVEKELQWSIVSQNLVAAYRSMRLPRHSALRVSPAENR